MDMIYDFDRVAPDYEATLVPTTIPTEEGEFGTDGNFIYSVKQSRLSFNGETETRHGDATSLIEFDLFGTGDDAGRTTFNFRHAWFTVGPWGVGQTWSTFMDISTWPNVVDWWGPSGMALNRNPQLRYTIPMGQSSLAFALEQQNASFNAGVFTELTPGLAENAQAKSELPDFIAQYRSVNDWGHVQIAGVARHLTAELRETNVDENAFGYGLNLTGIINTVGRDQLKFGLTGGEGIASFINDGGGSNLAPDADGITAVPSYGYMLYYDRYWSDQWSSSLGFSQNFNDTTELQTGGEVDNVTYISGNVLYQPSPSLLTGLEALYGERENVNGDDGSDFRIQFSAKYNFDHRYDSK